MGFLTGIAMLLAGCVPLYEILIEGTWKVDKYYKNGADETTSFFLLFGDYVITFHPDGDFTEKYMFSNILPITNSGTWAFINNARQLSLVDESSTRTFDVKSLTNGEMRLFRILGEGGSEEFLLEPKAEG